MKVESESDSGISVDERLLRAEQIYVSYPRLEELRGKITRCHQLSQYAAEPECLFIKGPTGTGKTTLYRRYEQQHPRRETDDGTIVPVLSATIPVPATVKSLVTKLLVNLGDPAAERGTTDSRTLRLSTLLKNCRVELIILDEFQHFIDRDSQRVLQNVSDWLKNLLNETSIPIVLVGMPNSDLVLEANPQLRRRFSARESLEPFGWEPVARRDDFRRFLKVLDSKLPFARSSHLADHAMALRFYYATDGVVANVMKLARRAAGLAVEGALDELTLPVLAQAYEECLASNNRGKSNPFAAEVDSLSVQTYQEQMIPPKATNNRKKTKRRQASASEVLHR